MIDFFSNIINFISTYPYVVIVILVALVFDFTNWMHDSANSIATIVSTRVLSPKLAVMWAAFFNFAAFFVVWTEVAKTIWKWMIDVSQVTTTVILCALLWAILWNILTWYLALPTSSSHALIWWYLWSAVAKWWTWVVIASGWTKTIIFIFLAPLIWMVLWFVLIILSTRLLKNVRLKVVNKISYFMQLTSSALYSLWHWANDAQKTMWIIVSLLMTIGVVWASAEPPLWVMLLAYSAIAMWTITWGWRIVKTMWSKIIQLRPIDWFSAETASAVSLFTASYFWVPISTTHAITWAISWVWIAKNHKAVRWSVASNIVVAWIFTIPWSCLVAFVLYHVISLVLWK
jgi:PiT family inorganic phosphate transporter